MLLCRHQTELPRLVLAGAVAPLAPGKTCIGMVFVTVPFKIISVIEQQYKGKNGKPDGVMHKAQCIIQRDGVTKIGQLFLSRDLVHTPPGDYYGEYAMDSAWDLDVGPVLVDLHPVAGGPSIVASQTPAVPAASAGARAPAAPAAAAKA